MVKPEKILETLERNGYEAYYVGGCVRDSLLGRPVHDWDITTSARPEQTMACFPHSIPTGIDHGTITVIVDEFQAEVTTFRSDGVYRDGRHPERVTFVPSLREDLARRDFTVNAMAMNKDGVLFDPMGGQEDLAAGILRCVGDPQKRFQEDALRMLRAVRFSAQLQFHIEQETEAAIGICASLCRQLSAERVREEVEKTLLSPQPNLVGRMIELGLLQAFGLYTDKGTDWLTTLPCDALVRWSGLCKLYPELDLTKLRLDRHTIRTATAASEALEPENKMQWKRLVADCGMETAETAAALWGRQAELQRICTCGECLTLKELAVSGRDLPWLQGKAVGQMLRQLLVHVWEKPEDNHKEILLQLAYRQTNGKATET